MKYFLLVLIFFFSCKNTDEENTNKIVEVLFNNFSDPNYNINYDYVIVDQNYIKNLVASGGQFGVDFLDSRIIKIWDNYLAKLTIKKPLESKFSISFNDNKEYKLLCLLKNDVVYDSFVISSLQENTVLELKKINSINSVTDVFKNNEINVVSIVNVLLNKPILNNASVILESQLSTLTVQNTEFTNVLINYNSKFTGPANITFQNTTLFESKMIGINNRIKFEGSNQINSSSVMNASTLQPVFELSNNAELDIIKCHINNLNIFSSNLSSSKLKIDDSFIQGIADICHQNIDSSEIEINNTVYSEINTLNKGFNSFFELKNSVVNGYNKLLICNNQYVVIDSAHIETQRCDYLITQFNKFRTFSDNYISNTNLITGTSSVFAIIEKDMSIDLNVNSSFIDFRTNDLNLIITDFQDYGGLTGKVNILNRSQSILSDIGIKN
jgi:hypothetical protein